MKIKTWIIGWLIIVIGILSLIFGFVYKVDPFFHYHKPHTDIYYYELYNERSQNDGISRNFDYDALITGTSMTANFKTSELDDIFGTSSIKVPFSGGSYKEVNDNIKVALKNNSNLKMIVRGLDTNKIFDEPDKMREDLGEYPTYLYDKNPFNDVKYVFNKDVIFSRAYMMSRARKGEGFRPGITSFDEYSNWQSSYAYGIKSVFPDGISFAGAGEPVALTEDEKRVIFDNITQNVTSTADMYPDVTFYYFFTPYSIDWYMYHVEDGTIYRQLEAEKYVIELMLEHNNIKLFSFNCDVDITSDFNNYRDSNHYAEWVNSYILRCMHDDVNLLTNDNYENYLDKELEIFSNFDYESLNEQEDYEDDSLAATLLNNR